jgi:hypothetical protein
VSPIVSPARKAAVTTLILIAPHWGESACESITRGKPPPGLLDPPPALLVGSAILAQPRPSSRFHIDRISLLILVELVIIWVAAMICGGSARADVYAVVILRLLAILSIGVVLIFGRLDRLAGVRGPIFFTVLLALAIGIQLIPLPPGFWASLPGREPIPTSPRFPSWAKSGGRSAWPRTSPGTRSSRCCPRSSSSSPCRCLAPATGAGCCSACSSPSC